MQQLKCGKCRNPRLAIVPGKVIQVLCGEAGLRRIGHLHPATSAVAHPSPQRSPALAPSGRPQPVCRQDREIPASEWQGLTPTASPVSSRRLLYTELAWAATSDGNDYLRSAKFNITSKFGLDNSLAAKRRLRSRRAVGSVRIADYPRTDRGERVRRPAGMESKLFPSASGPFPQQRSYAMSPLTRSVDSSAQCASQRFWASQEHFGNLCATDRSKLNRCRPVPEDDFETFRLELLKR